MTTLTEFLTARLNEDWALAQAATGSTWLSVVDTPDDDDHAGAVYADGDWDKWVANWEGGPANGDHIARHDPARVLAEVAAKRRIVERGGSECGGHADQEQYGSHHYPDPEWSHCDGCAAAESADADWVWTLRALASVYADHPDYDPAWA